ncbi:tetratricopeptide repeat protein [Nitrosomonas sp. ANs5]|uniref:tetratricopeptide repeat protein n=1 Tax=Nitrosomonas sp. ANs5 TaxID=3423941 RepID=UPI003D344893
MSYTVQDWHNFAYYNEQLLPLERGEEREFTLNNLMAAFIQLFYPRLAWYYARELVAQYPDSEYEEQAQSFIKSTEPFLKQENDELMGDLAFAQEEKFKLRVLHDCIRFLTETGHPAEAISAAEQLLEKIPNLAPVLNNLSLSQFMLGDVDQAISTARKVIAQDADNFHALGNLVRYHFLTAQFDQAQTYAHRLQQIDSDKPDFELKQAEAFAFLGDDKKVWAAYQQAKTKGHEANPVLLHLAAAASYRLGNEKKAWQLWQQAAKLHPGFSMAQESLAEKPLPAGKRNVPWYWPFEYWLPQNFWQLLELGQQYSGKSVQRLSTKEIERAMKLMLAERPYLAKLFPHILERGDRYARQFILNFIQVAATPELLQLLYDFAQSPHGSDSLRLEAAQFINQKYPAMLPEDRTIPMWIGGKQKELFMMGFQITDEPERIKGISEAMMDKHLAAYDLLIDEKLEAAERLFKEIITEAPDFYSAYNQLAVAYEKQGRNQEARALIEETHKRFPDYLFARAGLARIKARDKELEAARNLLKPLLKRPKLHISEFRALARAEIDIALADNQTETARTWLEIWQQVEDDNPELIEWKMRINVPDKLLTGLKKLLTDDS